MSKILAAAALAAAAIASTPATAAELIVNGDFSAGNTGFDTTFSYNSNSGGAVGNYLLANNGAAVCSCFAPVVDHSTGAGLFMLVDAGNNAPAPFWSQTFAVVAGTDYDFSLWAANLGTAGAQPAVSVLVNGAQVGTTTTLPYYSGANGGWQQINGTFNAGSATSITFALLNPVQTYIYNDMAIDDISVTGLAVAAVPEPATWAMTIGGFGLIGGAMRRRRFGQRMPAVA